MLSPRALFLAFPALLVVAGAVLMARNPEWQFNVDTSTTIEDGTRLTIGLSSEDEGRLRIINQKQQIADDLLHRRCTLMEAADRFLELNTTNREALENLRFAWQGNSDWERALRQAVAFARSLSRKDSDRYEATMTEIDEEASTILQSELIIR